MRVRLAHIWSPTCKLQDAGTSAGVMLASASSAYECPGAHIQLGRHAARDMQKVGAQAKRAKTPRFVKSRATLSKEKRRRSWNKYSEGHCEK